MKNQQLELYREYPQPNEVSVAKALVALVQRQMEKNSAPGKTLRDVHSKQHGCVKGLFIIEPSLPEQLRVGVFKTPKTYTAWIRFSNTGSFAPIGGITKDIIPDARGMAIKLLEVPGEKLLEGEQSATTQDFLLFTPKIFFTKDPAGFYELQNSIAKSKLSLTAYLVRNPTVLVTLGRTLKFHASLLELQYYSSVPYALGPLAVKYSTRPVNPSPMGIPFFRPSDNYLRERLVKQLSESSASFDFMIQVQTDPYKMPIENAIKVWDERLSPFRKVATVVIPKQEFDSPEQLRCCENSSFDPWRCLPEHRPLGSMNRARRIVYQAIAEFRHQRNQVVWREPVGNDPCAQP